jgi:hypothetical protein
VAVAQVFRILQMPGDKNPRDDCQHALATFVHERYSISVRFLFATIFGGSPSVWNRLLAQTPVRNHDSDTDEIIL